MVPRASAVKRHLEAVHEACVGNALYWAVAIFIPVSTCIFYLVWMRKFARDGEKPVVSLVRIDRGDCGQQHTGSGSAITTQIDEDLSELKHIRDHKVYDHLQQAQMDALTPESGPDRDYFQAWIKRTKNAREDVDEPGGSTLPHVPALRQDKRNEDTEALYEGEGVDSGRKSRPHIYDADDEASTYPFDSELPNNETLRSEQFEVEFKPSGNRVRCQHIELSGPIYAFQPSDGVQYVVERDNVDRFTELVLKAPLERGAIAIDLLSQYGNYRQKSTFSFTKRIIWARRLGLPSHRFVYLILQGTATLLPHEDSMVSTKLGT